MRRVQHMFFRSPPPPPKAIISLWNKQVALHPTSAHSPIPRVSRGLPHLFTSRQKEQNIFSLWACPEKPLRYGETGRYWIVSNCYSEYVCLAEASPLHPKEGRDFFAKINVSPYWKIIILEESGGGRITKNYKLLLNQYLIHEPGERREAPCIFILSSCLILARIGNRFLVTFLSAQLIQLSVVLYEPAPLAVNYTEWW